MEDTKVITETEGVSEFNGENNQFSEDTKDTKVIPETEGVFEFNGEDYQFSEDAPEYIRIDGEVLSQQEISASEDALLQLIGGGSVLIKKVKH